MLVGKVLRGLAVLGLVRMNGEVRVSPFHSVHELVCLLKVVEGVEEDHVNVGLYGSVEGRDHVVDSEAGQTKGGRLVEARERCDAPFQDVYIRKLVQLTIQVWLAHVARLTLWFKFGQLLVDELQVWTREVYIRQRSTRVAAGIARLCVALRRVRVPSRCHCSKYGKGAVSLEVYSGRRRSSERCCSRRLGCRRRCR